MTNALIVGPRGAGKSTLIRQILRELDRPVSGFETKRMPELADPDHGDPIYIRCWGEEWELTDDFLMGWCKDRHFTTRPGAFDRFAQKLVQSLSHGSVIAFDELGFMESQEEGFCDAVRSRLGGSIPVIAAVKNKDFPFLNEVRTHPSCRCFLLTPENRDEIYRGVLEFMQASCAKYENYPEV